MSYRSMTCTWTSVLSAAGLALALAAAPAAAEQGGAASGSADKQSTKPADRGAGEQITDAWILTKVKSQFVGEDALEHSDINVDVRNHVVTLKGTVASTAGKQRAEEIARKTEGVTRVDNELILGVAGKDLKDATKSAKSEAKKSADDVKEHAKATKDKASETTREAGEEAKQSAGKTKDAAGEAVGTTGAAVTDSWITTKVKSSFVGVDALEGSRIDVDTNNHVVTLRGTVPSEQAKNRAVSIAKQIDGVQSVKSELTVAAKK